MNESFIGKEYESNSCGRFKIIEYNSSKDVLVEFINTGYQTRTIMSSVRNGTIKDRRYPSVYGVGYLGDAHATSVKGVLNKQGGLWGSMMERCYSKKLHERFPTYIGCEVSDYFKNFSNFYEWCQDQIGFNCDDYELDKDLLIRGNKLYSEDTCVFIPKFLNSLLLTNKRVRGKHLLGVHYDKHNGAYKASISFKGVHKALGYYDNEYDAHIAYRVAKENYIKDVAKEYKDKVDIRVYNALISYEVSEFD